MIKEIACDDTARNENEYRGKFSVISGEYVRSSYKAAMKKRRAKFKDVVTEKAPQITKNITVFEKYFRASGHDCPLPAQFSRALELGLPSRSSIVDSLLYLELTSGVLMGVQDEAKFHGIRLRVGHAQGGETIIGFGGTVICEAGEPLILDEAGPIASVFQGPDRRVNIDDSTTNLAFFVFDAPGLDGSSFDDAVIETMTLLEEAGATPTVQSVGI